MAYASSPQSPGSWLSFVSVGGVASLAVSAVLFQVASHRDGRIFQLDRAQTLETLASACRHDAVLPLLVAVRGRVTCREPSKCELSGTPAVMRELVEEEVYMKEHSNGRVTQETFEVRREQEQREALLEDVSGCIRVDQLQHAAGLRELLEVKQAFRAADMTQSNMLLNLVNRAFKHLVKHGVRVTERCLPLNTTLTIVGELARDAVGPHQRPNGHANGDGQRIADAEAAGAAAVGGSGRSASGATAGPSGRPPAPSSSPSAASAASAAAAAAASAAAGAVGAELLGQAAAAAGGAAARALPLPYTLRMPEGGGPFLVTARTLPQLRSAMAGAARAIRVAAWGFGLLGTALVVRKVVQQLWLRRQQQRLKQLLAQAVAARRAAAAAGGGAAAGTAAAGGGGGGGGGGEGDDARAPGMCVVCLDRDADVVYSGCGHMGTCAACSVQLNKCPICRVASRTIRVYRP